MKKRLIGKRLAVAAMTLLMVLTLVSGCGAAAKDSRSRKTTTQEQTTTAVQTSQQDSAAADGNGKQDRTAADDTAQQDTSAASKDTPPAQEELTVTEDGEYSSKDEVALYLHLYEHLPDNYITKSEAKKLGWVSSEGNLWDVAPGKSIGGDTFGNREELLPTKSKRKYYECDIDYEGGYRGADRIIYSNDGLVYYTGDHYQTFDLLYGEE